MVRVVSMTVGRGPTALSRPDRRASVIMWACGATRLLRLARLSWFLGASLT